MTLNISLPDVGPNLRPKLTVIGIGGAGGNAVNNMINSNLEGVEFLVANTDAQSLDHSACEGRIQLGIECTKGLGAGMRPDIGRKAAEETIDEIKLKLEECHMLFIAAGMGGGTGTGAAPVIAQLAREIGILTVGVITKPFHFEGTQRMKLADQGLEDLQKYVDTLITIPNQNLFRIANEKTTFADAFKMADDVLYAGVRGVTDLMVQPGLINLDFSDIKTVMSEMGKAMMGTGEDQGEGRAISAAEAAMANPLIDDVSLKGAKGIIINITGGKDITLYEVDEAANRIKQEVSDDANIIYGTTCDERLEGMLRVSIVATGIEANAVESLQQYQQTAKLPINNSVYQQKTSNIANHMVSNPIESINSDSIKENNNDEDNVHDNELFNNEENNLVESQSLHKPIDNIEENITSSLDPSDSSDYTKDINEEVVNEEEIVKEEEILTESNEPVKTAKRMSLFDNQSHSTDLNDSEIHHKASVKQEPSLDEQVENKVETDKQSIEEEINPENQLSEEEFNQDNEEELLDIPTFLRRQAN